MLTEGLDFYLPSTLGLASFMYFYCDDRVRNSLIRFYLTAKHLYEIKTK